MKEFDCRVEFIKFRNNETGYTVFETHIEGKTEFVSCTLATVRVGEMLRISGDFEERRQGRTFMAQNAEELVRTASSLMNLLQSGMIKGVGPAVARKIIFRFGNETLSVLDSDIERLVEVPGITPKRLEAIKRSWSQYKSVGGTLVKLQDMGIPGTLALRILRKYGRLTDAVIRDNPYCLTDIWGVPFVLADTIALENGIEKDNSKRLEGGLRQVMKESVSEGHVYLPFDTLRTKAMDLLGVDGDKIRQTMVNMVLKTGSLCNEGRNIYLPEMLLVENNLASRLFELNVPPMELEEYSIEASIPGFEPMQKQAIENMIRYPVSILTGGPGTGKTTTIKEMVGILKKNDLRVALAAPTGRAAKRMAELTGFKAKTIHRLLRYRPSGSFAVNRNNPLRYDAVIVDECSMMDINLAQALMQAIIPGTRIVFVGDVDQLPSVGPGNVLRDIIDSQMFPTVRLTQVHRQALQSMIVTNSHRVNNGEEPVCNNGDFYFIPSDEENIPKKVAELVSRRLPGYSGLSSQDIQVLCPTRRMKDSINILLQEELNNGERINSVLKTGDKVMQLVNDYDKGVFNGDLGTIMGYNKETGEATIRFEDSDVLYSLEDLDEIEPAYAVTIHKSQGSEYPVVILTLGPSDRGMLQRNLLYTALTRARRLLVIVGSRDAVSQCVQNNRQSRRNSALTQKIKKVFGQAE